MVTYIGDKTLAIWLNSWFALLQPTPLKALFNEYMKDVDVSVKKCIGNIFSP